MPNKNEIKDELNEEYVDVVQPFGVEFLDNCCEIGEFLSSPQRLESGLKLLESQLQIKAESKLKGSFERLKNHYRGRVEEATEEIKKEISHLLSQELSRIEFENGFGVHVIQNNADHPEGKVPVFAKFISPTVFREQVQKGIHWKDPSVPGDHGEFTHRIQWYLICHCLRDREHKWVNTFKTIGQIVNPTDNELGLWDALVDRTNDTKYTVSDDFDCRSPEVMTRLIIGEFGAQHCPFLHWFIRARLKKRRYQIINSKHGGATFVEAQLRKLGFAETEIKENMENILGVWKHRGKNKGYQGSGVITPPGPLRK